MHWGEVDGRDSVQNRCEDAAQHTRTLTCHTSTHLGATLPAPCPGTSQGAGCVSEGLTLGMEAPRGAEDLVVQKPR